MGTIQEGLKNQIYEICLEKACLWLFRVEKIYRNYNIDLGIKKGRVERPGINFKHLEKSNRVAVVFLTTKNVGGTKVNLNQCRKNCGSFPFKGESWIFNRRVFKLPIAVLKHFAGFCGTCDEELKKRLKNEHKRGALR